MRKGRDVVFNCYNAFRECPLPVSAAVNGRALGFGFAIAVCADITIAADNAIFQMPEFGENIMPTIAMSALLGKLGASGPWRGILLEYRRNGAPATELGELEHAWHTAQPRHT